MTRFYVGQLVNHIHKKEYGVGEITSITGDSCTVLFEPAEYYGHLEKIVPAVFDDDGYDSEGFDRYGYDRKGYHRSGFDRDGFDRDGFDREGYNQIGFDREGYDHDGYRWEVYDQKSNDEDGYDQKGSFQDEFLSSIDSKDRNTLEDETYFQSLLESETPEPQNKDLSDLKQLDIKTDIGSVAFSPSEFLENFIWEWGRYFPYEDVQVLPSFIESCIKNLEISVQTSISEFNQRNIEGWLFNVLQNIYKETQEVFILFGSSYSWIERLNTVKKEIDAKKSKFIKFKEIESIPCFIIDIYNGVRLEVCPEVAAKLLIAEIPILQEQVDLERISALYHENRDHKDLVKATLIRVEEKESSEGKPYFICSHCKSKVSNFGDCKCGFGGDLTALAYPIDEYTCMCDFSDCEGGDIDSYKEEMNELIQMEWEEEEDSRREVQRERETWPDDTADNSERSNNDGWYYNEDD